MRFVENSRADAYPGAGAVSRERMLSCLFSVFSANDQVAFVLFGFVFSLPRFWGVDCLNCQVFFGMSITCEKPFSRIDPTLGTATYLYAVSGRLNLEFRVWKGCVAGVESLQH